MDKQTREKKEKKGKRPNGEDSVDTSTDRIKQLEDEWYLAKLENAFLKELRRLRLEEETKTKKRLTSYTASEDNSNWKTFSNIQVCQKPLLCTGRKDSIEKIQIKKLKQKS